MRKTELRQKKDIFDDDEQEMGIKVLYFRNDSEAEMKLKQNQTEDEAETMLKQKMKKNNQMKMKTTKQWKEFLSRRCLQFV